MRTISYLLPVSLFFPLCACAEIGNTSGASAPRNTPAITIRTLGTGAADHDWKNIGAPGVRGSAGTLVDGAHTYRLRSHRY